MLDHSTTIWGGPIRNSFYFGGIHSDTFGRENKTQERNRPCVKLTLFNLDEYTILQQPLEQSSDVLDMISLILGEDQDIVEVNKHKPIDHVSEHIVDECLQDRWELERPNGMTKYSKCPVWVLKAVFHSSPFLIRTR